MDDKIELTIEEQNLIIQQLNQLIDSLKTREVVGGDRLKISCGDVKYNCMRLVDIHEYAKRQPHYLKEWYENVWSEKE